MWMAADQFTTKVYAVQFVTIAVKYQMHFLLRVPYIVIMLVAVEAFILSSNQIFINTIFPLF